jgi:hypothetical protein
MPSSNNANLRGYHQISNAMIPPEGPKALQAVLDFTGGVTTAQVDLTQQTMPPIQISFVQGIFVDNSLNVTCALLVTNQTTRQTIEVPAASQQYVPVLASNPPIFTFAGNGNASPGVLVPVFFLNVPMPAMTWGGQSATGFTFSGSNLLVQDTAAETSLAALTALIASGGLNVNVISGGGGGGGSGPFPWSSNAFTGGASNVLHTAAGGKHFLLNGFQLSMSPLCTGGHTVQWNLSDSSGGNIMLGTFWVPTAAPTLTAAQANPIMVDLTGINYESVATAAQLTLGFSPTGAISSSFPDLIHASWGVVDV